MSKDITVQIKVQEAHEWLIQDYYCANIGFESHIIIPKNICTVIKTVEHVQELEQQIKDLQAKLNTYEIEDSMTIKYVQPNVKYVPSKEEFEKACSAPEPMEKVYPGSHNQKLFDLMNKNHGLVLSESEMQDIIYCVKSLTKKEVNTPKPQRKSLCMYEGVEVFDNTNAWFVDLKEFNIVKFDHMKHSIEVAGLECHLYDYSKMYLTPKEANARLKEEVEKKAMDCRKISFNDVCRLNGNVWDYAIELIEKEYGVTYLPE